MQSSLLLQKKDTMHRLHTVIMCDKSIYERYSYEIGERYL